MGTKKYEPGMELRKTGCLPIQKWVWFQLRSVCQRLVLPTNNSSFLKNRLSYLSPFGPVKVLEVGFGFVKWIARRLLLWVRVQKIWTNGKWCKIIWVWKCPFVMPIKPPGGPHLIVFIWNRKLAQISRNVKVKSIKFNSSPLKKVFELQGYPPWNKHFAPQENEKTSSKHLFFRGQAGC